jgi:hypothetical protein
MDVDRAIESLECEVPEVLKTDLLADAQFGYHSFDASPIYHPDSPKGGQGALKS